MSSFDVENWWASSSADLINFAHKTCGVCSCLLNFSSTQKLFWSINWWFIFALSALTYFCYRLRRLDFICASNCASSWRLKNIWRTARYSKTFEDTRPSPAITIWFRRATERHRVSSRYTSDSGVNPEKARTSIRSHRFYRPCPI